MAEQNIFVIEDIDLEIEPEVTVEEKRLVVLDHSTKKKIDETISTPDRYVSRYHYDTKTIDTTLELCPHCMKPTLSAFRRIVVDNAVDYLMEKEEERNRRYNRRRNTALVAAGISLLGGLYYWLFYVISGVRI
jgi:hypothetical protein